MPELPEVETIRAQLAPVVQGRRIERLEVLDARWSRPLSGREISDAVEGRTVQRLGRRGKYLLWSLSGDVHLAQHLRMTGSILCDPDPEPRHTRVRMILGAAVGSRAPAAKAGARKTTAAASTRLAFIDPRRFGTGELLLGSPALEDFLAARLGLSLIHI